MSECEDCGKECYPCGCCPFCEITDEHECEEVSDLRTQVTTQAGELEGLRAFHEKVESAYVSARTGGPGGKPLSPFFFGQRLRRTVGEARRALSPAAKEARP